MAKKFLYVDSNGLYPEANAYESADFIATSAGAGDAGKPIVLDVAGHIDATMINDGDIDHANIANIGTNAHSAIDSHIEDGTIHFTEGSIDHGSIAGLGDDDHTQYSLASGGRDYTGKVSYETHPTFSADEEIVDKKYVDDQIIENISALEWQDSALDYVVDNTLAPVTEVTGDRYILSHDGGTPHAEWDGASAGDIVEFNGTSWVVTSPTTGMHISADDELTIVYYWGGAAWTAKTWENTTASTGLTKVGSDIQLAAGSAGAGLAFLAGVLSVNATDGCEIVSDNVVLNLISGGGLKIVSTEVGVEPNDFAGAGLVDDGSDNLAIDWSTAFNDAKAVKASDLSSTANGLGASIIGIYDVLSLIDATDVEGALAELAGKIAQGVEYTVGAGGVTKGYLVYVSADNTVLPYTTLTAVERGIGLASTTEAAAATVVVAANDTVLTGILTTATAGDAYYWTGSGLSTTIPVGGGAYVWQVGIAKNATDLHVEVRFVKKNA